MPFEFLKYLQPTHYFRLKKYNGYSVFPRVDKIPESIINDLKLDDGFQSKKAQEYDLSWRAIQCGYLDEIETYLSFEKLPIVDNYRFIRKNFNGAWVFYVLILRLATFKNPIRELSSWLKTRAVRRDRLDSNVQLYNGFHNSKSNLISHSPKVSVIIPTLNRYQYLKDILKDLERQDYANFEVIVLDQSDNFNKDFYKDYNLNLKVIRQEAKALWLARNTGIQQSKGELIALSEDDVRVKPDWISLHIKCLDYFNSEISAGVFFPKGGQIPRNRSFFRLASHFATGNSMLYKSTFYKVGLFDRQFEKQRMGDGEFGMRVYLEGIKSVSNPYASCVDVKANTGGLREMGSWDAFRPSNLFAPRPIPSVLYYFRCYFGKRLSIYALLRTIPISVFPYEFKKNKPLMLIGCLITLFIFPLVIIQVLVSWKLASKKINQGPLIDTLD